MRLSLVAALVILTAACQKEPWATADQTNDCIEDAIRTSNHEWQAERLIVLCERRAKAASWTEQDEARYQHLLKEEKRLKAQLRLPDSASTPPLPAPGR
jgi:hypothetical protein